MFDLFYGENEVFCSKWRLFATSKELLQQYQQLPGGYESRESRE